MHCVLASSLPTYFVILVKNAKQKLWLNALFWPYFQLPLGFFRFFQPESLPGGLTTACPYRLIEIYSLQHIRGVWMLICSPTVVSPMKGFIN